MRIRTKISLLVITLIVAVVVSITANLFWLERSRLRSDFSARIDALLEGVLRISRESLSAQDELMLLSYLKFLMRDYPEIELAIVSRHGHVSVLGEVKTDLLYRTLALTERAAAQYRAAGTERGSSLARSEAQASIPPGTLMVQLGFSKAVLAGRVRQAQRTLAARMLALAAVGLLLGVVGSLWLGRLLARPVLSLAAAAEEIGAGRLDTFVETRSGDEIGALAGRFNRMALRLGELVRFKEDLFGTLSHELNTPLGGLKGFLDHLQGPHAAADPRKLREDYQIMSESVRQMEVSLQNALDLFLAGAPPALRVESLCLGELLAEAMRLFAPLAQTSAVALRGPAGPPGLRVWADREMTRRVFVNLISNALKYTPPGGTVTVAFEEEGLGVRASVSDTGSGIAPEDRERIFTKFYRSPGPGGAHRRIPGSGLGLAIAKKAVEAQKGRLWVESEIGKGSVFYVLLPKRGEAA